MRCETVREWLAMGERAWQVEAEGEELGRHLESCASCRAERERLESLRSSLDLWTLAAAPASDPRVLSELLSRSERSGFEATGSESNGAEASTSRLRPRPSVVRVLAPLLAAAGLLAALFLVHEQRKTQRSIEALRSQLTLERTERDSLVRTLEARLEELHGSLALLDEEHRADLVLLARAVDDSVRQAVARLRAEGRRVPVLDDPRFVSLRDLR